MRRHREQHTSLTLRLTRPIGQEVVNRHARLAGHQLPAERLRPSHHLVECAQDDGVADILDDQLTALGKPMLLAQLRR